jgi:hypothetical protein
MDGLIAALMYRACYELCRGSIRTSPAGVCASVACLMWLEPVDLPREYYPP